MDEPTNRLRHRAAGDEMQVRESDEIEDAEDVFEVRLPVASTGPVRNDGDDPLTRDEIDGMARQIDRREIGVFPAHGGDDMIALGRYSPFEKLGTWRDADVQTRDAEDADLLMATARMPDPETLPAATGDYRQALAILKEQAKRDVALDSSIGWRDDEDFPGGVDLMEVSIVGIGADWRTNTGDEQADVAARAFGVEIRDTNDSMTDDDTPDAEQDGGTTDDDEQTERGDYEDKIDRLESRVDEMYDMNKEELDILREMSGDAEDEDEDDDGEQSAAPDAGEEQDADDGDTETHDADDDDGEQSADHDDELAERLAELEAELEAVRSGDVDVDRPETDTDDEQDADADESDEQTRDAEGGDSDGLDNLGDYRL